MGYRVGIQCIESLEAANDYVLSAVQPSLDSDGLYSRPEKVGNQWFYQGQEVSLSFPECSFINQFADGATVGAGMVSLFAVMFGFKVVKSFMFSFRSGKSDS